MTPLVPVGLAFGGGDAVLVAAACAAPFAVACFLFMERRARPADGKRPDVPDLR